MQNKLKPDLSPEILDGLRSLGNVGRAQPGFSFGVKSSWQNRFDHHEEVLFFTSVSRPGDELPPVEDWACLRLDHLRSIISLQDVDPDELEELISECLIGRTSPSASGYALLHAVFPPRFSILSVSPAVLAGLLGNQDPLPVNEVDRLPFEPSLPLLCRQVEALAPAKNVLLLGMRGLLCGADDLASLLKLFEKFKLKLDDSRNLDALEESIPVQAGDWIEILKDLRPRVCALRGQPLVLHLDTSPTIREVLDSPTSSILAERGLPFPGFFTLTGEPLWLDGEIEEGKIWPPESRVGTTIILRPGLGLLAAADSPAEARRSAEIFHMGAAALAVSGNADLQLLPKLEDVRKASEWEQVASRKRLPFAGEVAVVTGAASGIGKAAVQSLLERGSAVVGLDINPAIKANFVHPSYRGFVCDVANEAAVRETIQRVILWAGGLDMLVLNAGMFPSGCDIDKMNLAEFTRVINVNFIANLVMMREAHPYLSRAPRYGRVVMVGSRNIRAPGPGASAYSTSKAALTQLARVAALEWGPDRIRVNVIHPDSVFDTALYTEEVLAARSAHYGMTVEQYKKRNLLKVEITSRDVAEMIAEMCGPLFRNMTGAQIQFDGGNDRTL